MTRPEYKVLSVSVQQEFGVSVPGRWTVVLESWQPAPPAVGDPLRASRQPERDQTTWGGRTAEEWAAKYRELAWSLQADQEQLEEVCSHCGGSGWKDDDSGWGQGDVKGDCPACDGTGRKDARYVRVLAQPSHYHGMVGLHLPEEHAESKRQRAAGWDLAVQFGDGSVAVGFYTSEVEPLREQPAGLREEHGVALISAMDDGIGQYVEFTDAWRDLGDRQAALACEWIRQALAAALPEGRP